MSMLCFMCRKKGSFEKYGKYIKMPEMMPGCDKCNKVLVPSSVFGTAPRKFYSSRVIQPVIRYHPA